MRKRLTTGVRFGSLLMIGFLFLSGSAAHAQTMTSSTASSTGMVNIQIMKHLCNSSIKNAGDFENLEKGLSPVAALANTVLNCPATGLPGNMAVAGTVASPRTTYDFQIMGEDGSTVMMSNGMYMPGKLCESDIKIDVNHDGTISSTTCLDISHYQLNNVMTNSGRVSVRESNSPAGFHFGVIRFTPPEVDGNNDAQSLRGIDPQTGNIFLSTKNDTDHTVMLHVYNFATDSSMTGGGSMSGSGTTMITVNLYLGSRGADVMTLQNYLIAQGYLTVPTAGEYYGPLTKHAVMKWQKAAGIRPTGFFGAASRAAFNNR